MDLDETKPYIRKTMVRMQCYTQVHWQWYTYVMHVCTVHGKTFERENFCSWNTNDHLW